jgi:hypothetical protein
VSALDPRLIGLLCDPAPRERMMVDSNDSYKKYAHSGAEAIQLGRKRHLAAISQRPLSKRALSTRI